jgi:hypothetical protein
LVKAEAVTVASSIAKINISFFIAQQGEFV